jgi:hypothetical protein
MLFWDLSSCHQALEDKQPYVHVGGLYHYVVQRHNHFYFQTPLVETLALLCQVVLFRFQAVRLGQNERYALSFYVHQNKSRSSHLRYLIFHRGM